MSRYSLFWHAFRLGLAWAVLIALACASLRTLALRDEAQEGVPLNVGGATHQEEVTHGPSHHFYGENMDAQNPNNVVCEPHAADASIACPAACIDPKPAGTPRVRRAVHTLSADQWNRVVRAMWVMRTTPTPEGVELCGPFCAPHRTLPLRLATRLAER